MLKVLGCSFRDKKFGIENKFRPNESLGLIQWRNHLIAAYPPDALNEMAFPMPLWFDFGVELFSQAPAVSVEDCADLNR